MVTLNSSSKCNVRFQQRDEVVVKELIERAIPSCFSRTIIQIIDRVLHLLPRDLAEVRALREKLAQETVGAFIDTPLPG